MSGDVKEFYRRKLHADISNLGVANLTLVGLAARWDDRAEEIENIMKALKEFQALLNVEGHMGYHPNKSNFVKAEEAKITLVRNRDVETVEPTSELTDKINAKLKAEELAKKVEAKRLAELNAKVEKAAADIYNAEVKAAKKAELEAKLAELEVE